MVIYHLNMTVISRKAGRSATASAAYRSGEKIVDERTGEVHDYRRKQGVIHTEIVTPEEALAWARDRAALWNAVEQHNRRADAIVAREINLALPHELSAFQRRDLAYGFARHIADRYQVAVDLAIHRPNGPDLRNHHAHLLLTTNRLGPAGLGTKSRELDPIATAKAGPGTNAVEQLRQAWAERANHALEHAGQSACIDHRTLEAQGIDREPTRHLGPAATGYERRTGTPSRRRVETQIDPNTQRKIAALTRDLETTQQRLADLEETRQERAESARRRQAKERKAHERQAQEQKRLERMTAKELAAEIQRLTPCPVEEVLDRHPEIVAARFEAMQRRREVRYAQTVAYRAQLEAAQWRDAHPLLARLHSLGVSQPYLAERERLRREQTQREKALSQAQDQADQQTRQIADRLRPTVIAEQQQAQAHLVELEKLRQAKIAQEQAQERQEATLERFQAVQKPQVAPKSARSVPRPP